MIGRARGHFSECQKHELVSTLSQVFFVNSILRITNSAYYGSNFEFFPMVLVLLFGIGFLLIFSTKIFQNVSQH